MMIILINTKLLEANVSVFQVTGVDIAHYKINYK